MTFTDAMGLLGGLALFLYGMQMMSDGLEAAAGNKMKQILEKLTANRFMGVLVGMVITAIIQSSSATTVMVVGFVNSGMMTLRQAVWIIMGANIGTTITGQLIALDVGAIAPLIAFAGVVCVVFLKGDKIHHIGKILAGLGVLFIGMDMMGAAMKPLANAPEFVGLLTRFENPVLGILAGMVFTAIIQSSSASVGILQALAGSGVIGLSSAAFVLFGQNIGTCITALLASIGTNRNARRTTIIHFSFNIIGTVLFTTLCLVTPLISIVEGITPESPQAQIANLHTFFNILTTLILIPFGNYLATFSEFVLKDKPEAEGDGETFVLKNIKQFSDDQLGVSAISMEGTKLEIMRMLDMAKSNVYNALEIFYSGDSNRVPEVDAKEDYVDYLNKEISKYITKVITHERTEKGSHIYNSYFSMTSDIERISDHAVNVAGYSIIINERNITLSDVAKGEVLEIQKTCDKMLALLFEDKKDVQDVVEWHAKVASMETEIDKMTKEFRNNMYARIKKGTCTDEGSILFSEMLTDFERIGDHALNISDEMMQIKMMGFQ